MVDNSCVFGINSCGFFKVYKRWFRRIKKSSSLTSSKDNSQSQNQTQQENVQHDKTTIGTRSFRLNRDEYLTSNDNNCPMRPIGCCLGRHRSFDSSCFPSINTVPRNERKKVNLASTKNYDFVPTPSSSSWSCSDNLKVPPQHSGNISNRRGNNPIMYSNSSGMIRPPPIEKKLECTLEELCYGCKKKIMITRDVLTDTGGIVQEEELLTINVQPGWKKGTKITFEGKGNERPGAYREDIIFIISEKRHELFRRVGDDLELSVEIPLVKALTGCTILVPLLGAKHMNLALDNIIHPGSERIIPGQGMSISKEPGKRGNLKITFLVEFPKHLTSSQRSNVVRILQDC